MRRVLALLAESLRIAASQPISTLVTAVVIAGVCAVIMSTTGQTVAIERDVLASIDDAGTRTIVIEDVEGRAGLDVDTVARVQGLSGVEWAIGLGIASDVRVVGLDGGAAVPIRAYVGDLPEVVSTSPWRPGSDVALAGVDTLEVLGFAVPAGTVEAIGREEPRLGVVGWLDAAPPLDFLNRALLTVAEPDELVVRIIVLGRSAEQVPAVAEAIGAVLYPDDPGSVSVRTPEALVQVRAAVRGDLGTWGRNIVSLLLAAGLVLTALNVFGAVTTRRRDFGRRRALGASRAAIVVLVTVQTGVTALIGAVVGTCLGAAIVQGLLGIAPSLEFAVAISVLAVLAAGAAALPPALLAAYRDPVRILRVP